MKTVEDAVVALLRRFPFYGQILVALPRESAGGAHPVGLTIRGARPILHVNEKRYALLRPQERQALLVHVVRHLVALHLFRREGRNGRDWDLACDVAVNTGIEGLPPGAPLPATVGVPEGLGAEEYYDLLVDPFDTGSMDGHGRGKAAAVAGEGSETGGAGRVSGATDDHGGWAPAEEVSQPLAEEIVRGIVREAVAACGDVPSELREAVGRLLSPSPTPWRMVLRQFVATAGRTGRRGTWRLENRRFGAALPGVMKRRKLHVLIAVDVSDSTDGEALREEFAREVVAIGRGRESRLTVVYSTTRIRRIETFRRAPACVEVQRGGGFTDLRPVFELAKTLVPPPAAVIYLTDGYGEAPEKMDVPTLWVLPEEGRKPAPWGVELRLQQEVHR